MTHQTRVLIFIGAIVLVLLGLVSAPLWSNGYRIPQWPALTALAVLYFYLFPKKQKKQK
jgi:hypothetical protein